MAKKLRDVLKNTGKPSWAQSKPAKETHASEKQKVDRGSENDKNFSAEYVPTFNRSDNHYGYDAGTNDEPMNEQMDEVPDKPFVARLISRIRRKKNESDAKKAEGEEKSDPWPFNPLYRKAPVGRKAKRPKKSKVDPNQTNMFDSLKEDEMTQRIGSWQGRMRNKAAGQFEKSRAAKAAGNKRGANLLNIHGNRNNSYAGQMAEAEALMAEGYSDDEIIAYFESKETD